MKMMKTILSLVVMAAALMGTAAAVNYTVGSPDGGWDQSTNLQTWPTSLTFVEGDNLIFRYTTNHDVTEVSRSDYESCRATNPLQPRLTGGAAVVPLTSAGTRYFICGSAGHCISGMKLAITTTAAASPPPPSTTTAPPPSSKTTTPSPPPPPPPPTTPSPTPKHSKAVMPTPPQPAASAPSGSALPPPTPPPSAAAKVGLIGGFLSLKNRNF
ncbi:uclacyanin 1-like [Salvia hispanica]|uniref:uclacyanin 1-like n=1 Tax=Salvia hispanica TaxID=49212 RepID=UPI00200959CD|nr:uclacyanin 1-like [Salvia hispanica]